MSPLKQLGCNALSVTAYTTLKKENGLHSFMIKGDIVSYQERYYFCSKANDEECEFESASMTNENLLAACNAYRKQHNLLTSDEIREIRETYGLTQVEFARLMGWGDVTISRYESKSIQDDSYNTMLCFVRDNPMGALEMLEKNQARFDVARSFEIRNTIKEKIDAYGKEYFSRCSLESDYVYFENPSDENGWTCLDIDKVEACVSYLAERVDNLFKVKLMKMLWYSGVCMELYGKAITGLVYQHEPMGALPIGHYNLVGLEKLNVIEESSWKYDVTYHFLPTSDENYAALTDNEKGVLNMVIAKFKTFSSKEIVDYMHNEIAYEQTEKDSIIPFSLAKQIRDF